MKKPRRIGHHRLSLWPELPLPVRTVARHLGLSYRQTLRPIHDVHSTLDGFREGPRGRIFVQVKTLNRYVDRHLATSCA